MYVIERGRELLGNEQRRRPFDSLPAALVLTTGFGTAAGAEPVAQEGLVNLNLTGMTAQLPIDLAANLCDVAVDVLVNELSDGSAPCTASSNSDAVVTTEDGGPVAQEGLVNVNVTDVVVQRRSRSPPTSVT